MTEKGLLTIILLILLCLPLSSGVITKKAGRFIDLDFTGTVGFSDFIDNGTTPAGSGSCNLDDYWNMTEGTLGHNNITRCYSMQSLVWDPWTNGGEWQCYNPAWNVSTQYSDYLWPIWKQNVYIPKKFMIAKGGTRTGLYFDDSSFYMGMGTESPQGYIHVEHDNKVELILSSDNTVSVNPNMHSVITMYNDAEAIKYQIMLNDSSHDLEFIPDDGPLMVLDRSGNLSVGTIPNCDQIITDAKGQLYCTSGYEFENFTINFDLIHGVNISVCDYGEVLAASNSTQYKFYGRVHINDYTLSSNAAGSVSVDSETLYIGRDIQGAANQSYRGIVRLNISDLVNKTLKSAKIGMILESYWSVETSQNLEVLVYYNDTFNYTSSFCNTNKELCWNASNNGGLLDVWYDPAFYEDQEKTFNTTMYYFDVMSAVVDTLDQNKTWLSLLFKSNLEHETNVIGQNILSFGTLWNKENSIFGREQPYLYVTTEEYNTTWSCQKILVDPSPIVKSFIIKDINTSWINDNVNLSSALTHEKVVVGDTVRLNINV